VGPIGRTQVAWLIGARVAETILASGRNRSHQQAGHMDASDPIRPTNLLCHGGRPHMGPGSALAMLACPGRQRAFPRRVFARVLQSRCSLFEQRAQGKPGAGCARSPAWERKHAGGNYRFSRDIPAFPAQWLYGLLRALPGERPFLSPLPRHHRAARIDARVAAPGPHDFAVRCGRFVRRAFVWA
jgi:hypothetical protein